MAILTGDAEEAALVDSQWLFTSSDLEQTPTVVLGLMNVDEERRKRANGVGLIYSVGERMRLMSHVVTTAAAFFHRFFMRRPMRPVGYIDPIGKPVTFDYQDVALAALYLAGKTEESYRKLTDLVGVGLEHENRIAESLEQPSEATLRSAILRNEERLLETLCFDLIVPHPQKYLLLAANRLGISVDNKPLVRIAYAHIHDAFRDPVCLFYEAPVLAAGALALACEDLGMGLETGDGQQKKEGTSSSEGAGSSKQPPRSLTLLEAFDVDQEEVDAVLGDLKAVRSILDKDPKINRGARPTPTASGSATPYHRSWNAPPPPPSRGELGVGVGAGPSRSMAGTPLRGGVSGSVNTSPLVPPPMERVAAAAAVGTERPDLTRPPSRHGSARAEGAVPFGSPPMGPVSSVRPPPPPAAAPYRLLSPVLTQPEPSTKEAAAAAAPPPAPEATRASSSTSGAPPIVVQPAAKSSYVPLSPPNYNATMDVDPAPPPAAAAAVEQEAARKVAEEQRRTEQSQSQGAKAGASVVSAANSVVRSDAEEGEIDE